MAIQLTPNELIKDGDPVNQATSNKPTLSLINKLGTLAEKNQVGTQDIQDNQVTLSKLQSNSVSQAKITSNQVTEDKLQNNQVTQDKLQTNQVTTQKISQGQVSNQKLQTNQVTDEKVQLNSVSGTKLLDNSTPYSKLENIPADYVLGRTGDQGPVQQISISTAISGQLGSAQTADIGEDAGNVIQVPMFGIGQSSETYIPVYLDLEQPQDLEQDPEPEIPEDDNYYWEYQDLRELKGGSYQIDYRHPQNPLNEDQTLIVTMHSLGSSTLLIQGKETPEIRVQTVFGSPSTLNWQKVALEGTQNQQHRTNSQNDARFIQGGSVIQVKGNSEVDVVSQKLLTTEIDNLQNELSTVNDRLDSIESRLDSIDNTLQDILDSL